MNVEVYILNAFGLIPEGGNPAGVVLASESLSERDMGRIAEAVGLPETCFILPSEICDFKLRFFTPACREVDLCGHAIIAAYSLLFSRGEIAAGNFTQELKAGNLNVGVTLSGHVVMEQTKPEYGLCLDKAEVAEILRLDLNDVDDTRIPIQIVSTGYPNPFIPVSSREILDSLEPNFEAMSDASRRYQSGGFHIFCLSDTGPSAYCRNFAPLNGIPEEAATGSASGALACLLHRSGISGTHFEFEQGWAMHRPSRIEVELELENDSITAVRVSGSATPAQIRVVSV